VFAFDLFIVFILFIVFFMFILVPRHQSCESVKIGPHPRGHPSSGGFFDFHASFFDSCNKRVNASTEHW
jgi:hypothetical protein